MHNARLPVHAVAPCAAQQLAVCGFARPTAQGNTGLQPAAPWDCRNLACSILDALPEQVVVLDARGNVLAGNSAWHAFAQSELWPGPSVPDDVYTINYIDIYENVEETVSRMFMLEKAGVRFSLDDFGTGYSSLQYLKRLPLCQLKIDQSFVRDLATDQNDQAIVLTIISMARSLQLDVIAEGVETLAQQELLERLGCANYQGYLFSRPVPANEFESLLGAGTTPD